MKITEISDNVRTIAYAEIYNNDSPCAKARAMVFRLLADQIDAVVTRHRQHTALAFKALLRLYNVVDRYLRDAKIGAHGEMGEALKQAEAALLFNDPCEMDGEV